VGARIDKRDLPWAGLLSASFVVGLAISWERWGNPLVDCGREMNQPLRLLRGEMLYSDVRHIYGPLSPYLNAALYRIFGPSLNVLYADGIVSAILILALVYWLARQVMGRAPSAAATLSVMWLCAFKQAGNYILPYSYSALHGCAFGLASLALLVKAVRGDESASDSDAPERPVVRRVDRTGYFVWAGIVGGLTLLSKTEMGIAALAAGLIAAAASGYPRPRAMLTRTACFIAPMSAIAGGVYAIIASRVGWHTLSYESFLFLRHVPSELVYFNKRISGFDQPWQSLWQVIEATARVAALAFAIGMVSLVLSRRRPEAPGTIGVRELTATDAGKIGYGALWLLLALSVALLLLVPMVGTISWDTGPYMAMPVLLGVLLARSALDFRKQTKAGEVSGHTLTLIVVAVYALASLTRVILRVRSGGAYSSYLLPASVILFVYCWAHPFADCFRDSVARGFARKIAVALIIADVVATAGLLAFRYQSKNTYPVQTARGTIVAVPDLGQSVVEAIDYIKRETLPTEPIAVMPEGTSLNFFTDRPNPLREEITTPGYLDREGEERAINQLEQSETQLVLVTNRPTPEFGPQVFGRDYCQSLMEWIDKNFEQCAIFGPNHDPNLQITDKTFFIRAYRRRPLKKAQS